MSHRTPPGSDTLPAEDLSRSLSKTFTIQLITERRNHLVHLIEGHRDRRRRQATIGISRQQSAFLQELVHPLIEQCTKFGIRSNAANQTGDANILDIIFLQSEERH